MGVVWVAGAPTIGRSVEFQLITCFLQKAPALGSKNQIYGTGYVCKAFKSP